VLINSFFAVVQDDPSVQIVNDAQIWYVEQQVVGTELEGLPILSAGAPFKTGFGNPANYTDIAAGPISLGSVADLYLYPNTLKVVRLTGAQIRLWLERAAGIFNQIDPNSTAEQALINTSFPSYNFDVIDGLTYQIDVTQPSRYDSSGGLANAEAARIVDLRYNGEPIVETQEFLVVTNNYRAAGGGNFPGLDGSTIVIDAPDENRQIIARYILDQVTINPSADGNWSIAPINAEVLATFATSPSARAADYATNYSRLVNLNRLNDNGYAEYRLDLAPAPGLVSR